MDIKNIIIALLAATLGIALVDATNLADIIPNIKGLNINYQYLTPKTDLNPNEAATIDNPADILKSVDEFHDKFNDCFGNDAQGNPLPGFSQDRKGVFISFSAIANVLKAHPLNAKNLTADGIVCMPYVDATGLNVYLTVDNAGFDNTVHDPAIFNPFPVHKF